MTSKSALEARMMKGEAEIEELPRFDAYALEDRLFRHLPAEKEPEEARGDGAEGRPADVQPYGMSRRM